VDRTKTAFNKSAALHTLQNFSGLLEGDSITHLNNRPVTTEKDVKAVLNDFVAGQDVVVTVKRGGKVLSKILQLGGKVCRSSESKTSESSNKSYTLQDFTFDEISALRRLATFNESDVNIDFNFIRVRATNVQKDMLKESERRIEVRYVSSRIWLFLVWIRFRFTYVLRFTVLRLTYAST